MGLKCSILGHRFEETEVERDREEQGSEVVTTIRELETCTRCGERQVVSENKEVTTLATPDESTASASDDDATVITEDEEATVGSADGAPERPSDDASAATADDASAADDAEPVPTADDSADSAEIIDETTTATIPDAEGDRGSGESTPSPDAETDEVESEPTDDAVILDEEESADEREPGTWPDEPDDRLQSPEDAADWPETGRDPGDADEELATTLLQDTDETRPANEADVTVPEGTYRCEECGFTTDVEASSLRRGDFCPECHRGTLVQDVEEN